MMLSDIKIMLQGLMSDLESMIVVKSMESMNKKVSNGKGRLLTPMGDIYKSILDNSTTARKAVEMSAYWVSKSFRGKIDYSSLEAIQYMVYGFLLTGLVYCVDVETGDRGIYTLSEETINYLFINGFIDIGSGGEYSFNERIKIERLMETLADYNICSYNIRAGVRGTINNNDVLNKINSTIELAETKKMYKLYAYRLDTTNNNIWCGLHKKFKVVKPRTLLDINKSIFIPMRMYNRLSERYIEFLQGGDVVYIKNLSGCSGLFTLDEEILKGIYGNELAEKSVKRFKRSIKEPYYKNQGLKAVDTYSKILVPSISVSPLAKSGVSIDKIAISGVLKRESVIKFLKQGSIKIGSDILRVPTR